MEIVGRAAQGLLETTGNRMADFLRTANLLERQQVALLTEIRDQGAAAPDVAITVEAPNVQVKAPSPVVVPAAEVTVQPPPPVVIPAPQVVVQAAAPIVVPPPTVVVDRAAPVVVPTPEVTVEAPSPLVIPAPALSVEAPSPVVVPAPDVVVNVAPDVIVEAPAPAIVPAPEVTVEAAAPIVIPAPDVVVEAAAPVIVPPSDVIVEAAAPPIMPTPAVTIEAPAPVVVPPPSVVVNVAPEAPDIAALIRQLLAADGDFQRQEIDLLTAIKDQLAPFLSPPSIPLVQPPAFSGSLGAGAQVGGGNLTLILQGGITVEVPAGVVTDQNELQQFLAGPLPTAFVRKVSEGLAIDAKAIARAQQGIVRVVG